MINPYLSIVMPCLNEAETLETCIKKANSYLTNNKISGEIIIADNGSTDGSIGIAQKNGARVVNVVSKGYGSALQGGINAANGTYIVMGDADDSYDFSTLTYFVDELAKGCDLVMGNRFKGGIEKGAMPFLHRYLGNPVLSFIGGLFFKSPIKDFHCGLRGFSKEAYIKMELKSTGMEFASEMVVKATLMGMKITEVPTTLSKDGRNRPPHLNTWQDGWRHLRFLITYAPKWFLLYPGSLLLIVSLIFGSLLTIEPLRISNIQLDVHIDVHTLLYAMVAALLATQLLFMYVIVKRYKQQHILYKKQNQRLNFNLETGLIAGVLLLLIGVLWSYFNISAWSDTGYSELNPSLFMRKVIPAVFLISLGVQTMVSSFVMALIGDQKK
ncbi:glycosyltransferase family 2 protein [Arenibacter amylolyticus]|uniref:glycosyltransferase family 2 protein n=1 Tax=Arenibacter amylolyticus TaxID=1406873 RepID=UPI001FE43F3F|nr:glycosyltransferase family 2 protein [Arenibacter amylolyticus]